MMKYGIFALLLCFYSTASAQDNPLLMPVHLVNGRIFSVTDGPDDPAFIKKAHIKTIRIFSVTKKDNVIDTTTHYIADFTSKGDQIPRHHEFRYFDGFNSITYNSNGTMAAKQWKNIEQLGCGTGGITILHKDYHTDYIYRKKQLVLEINSSKTQGGRWKDSTPVAGLHTAYRYLKNGLKVLEERYFLPYITEKDTAKDVHYFRYNSKGNLSQVYCYNSMYSPSQSTMDSLITQADEALGTILLRQSYQWHDTVMRYAFPEKEGETDEAYEAREAAVNYRDSVDAERMDFYEDDKNGFEEFIGYEYNKAGLLNRKLHFKETDLSRIDSFTYLSKGKLSRWETWHLDNDGDFAPWENTWFMPLPMHAVWIFTYDQKGRVASCTLFHEASPPVNYVDRNYHFKVQREMVFNMQYDRSGRINQVAVHTTKYNYNMNPDMIPPVVHDTDVYYISYNTW